jgi:2-polyprenyl-3-methyl-5-hydroxy-6-metoxy-1,4-benzoquinol methylase
MMSFIKGLKYPDEYIIKYFFKKKFDKKKNKRVLELGCSNGNNLDLFFNYGWNTRGIDVSSKCISDANHNFDIIKMRHKLKNNFSFLKNDMLDFLEKEKKLDFNVIIFSNSLYYLDYSQIKRVLENLKKKVKKNTDIFFRIRLVDDFRAKLCKKKIMKKTYLINFNCTNEFRLKNTFFRKAEFENLLKKYFTIKEINMFKVKYENLIKNKTILNSDLVLWLKT